MIIKRKETLSAQDLENLELGELATDGKKLYVGRGDGRYAAIEARKTVNGVETQPRRSQFPIGTVLAWLPGHYANGSGSGFTPLLPEYAWLDYGMMQGWLESNYPGWMVCRKEYSALSPIWNSSERLAPSLNAFTTEEIGRGKTMTSVFTAGSGAMGAQGDASSDVTWSILTNVANHSHSASTLYAKLSFSGTSGIPTKFTAHGLFSDTTLSGDNFDRGIIFDTYWAGGTSALSWVRLVGLVSAVGMNEHSHMQGTSSFWPRHIRTVHIMRVY